MKVMVDHKKVKQHPLQPRYELNVEALGELLEMVSGSEGLQDGSLPVVRKLEDESYVILAGHRRYMAWCFWKAGVSAEDMVETFYGEDADSDRLFAYCRDELLEESVEIPLWETHEYDENPDGEAYYVLRDNYGRLQNDLLGECRAFSVAVDHGLAVADIARQIGRQPVYVENRIAWWVIFEKYPDLMELFSNYAGTPNFGVVQLFLDLPENRREGVRRWYTSKDDYRHDTVINAERLTELFAALARFMPTPSLEVMAIPFKRNLLAVLKGLQDRLENGMTPELWGRVANVLIFYRGRFPWEMEKSNFVAEWIYALGGDSFVTHNKQTWMWEADWQALALTFTEVRCQTCPIAVLKGRPPLWSDLKYPCRSYPKEVHEGCLFGLLPDDEVLVMMPLAWRSKPGLNLVERAGIQFATNMDEVVEAYEQAASLLDESGDPVYQSEPDLEVSSEKPKERPVDKMRHDIHFYQDTHENFTGSLHPLATRCRDCVHVVDGGKQGLGCRWAQAGGLRWVDFRVYLTEGMDYRIPVCRQFTPSKTWAEILPKDDQAPEVSRDYLVELILWFHEHTNAYVEHGGFLQQLTGRPMVKSDPFGHWFKDKFNEVVGDLSTNQLWWLFKACYGEKRRASNSRGFSCPDVAGQRLVLKEEGYGPKVQ